MMDTSPYPESRRPRGGDNRREHGPWRRHGAGARHYGVNVVGVARTKERLEAFGEELARNAVRGALYLLPAM